MAIDADVVVETANDPFGRDGWMQRFGPFHLLLPGLCRPAALPICGIASSSLRGLKKLLPCSNSNSLVKLGVDVK